ncbi:hypothetical protein F7725_008694 [Dissostichus mawsoni]|uniref:Taxilin beta b n=1 Tax=Dissostichus mawsoni TaxID=36200 RepID=A0A7J5Y999_DISMA|nr:hypothetical protein F7725_008694 [Dissostichus mawsoni]
MEACLAPGCPDLDLTEDLAQQLEDIISTYQEEESPPDQTRRRERRSRPQRRPPEETLQRCREDDLKRKEITTHFQGTLGEIQAQIEEHSGRNTKLCEENGSLAEKLKGLITQYDQREARPEAKLLETKLTQSNVILKETEDKHKLERELLAMYSEKFDEFQGTVSKSNSVYSGFKLDMDKMAKKMKKLDKECQSWKSRFDNCNKGLVEMVNDNQKLENLCRALQEERRSSSVKVQEAGKTDSQSQELPEEEEEAGLREEEEQKKEEEGQVQRDLEMQSVD